MFISPKKNIAEFGIREGMSVADFGVGSGAYTRALSDKVGNKGKVYAIDIQKALLEKLESDLKEIGISNVNYIWGDVEKVAGTKIADQSLDAVVISNILFQIENKDSLINEARRILKKDGRLLLIDWSESYNNMGPARERVVAKSQALELFTKQGFKIEKEISVGEHHYGIIFLYE